VKGVLGLGRVAVQAAEYNTCVLHVVLRVILLVVMFIADALGSPAAYTVCSGCHSPFTTYCGYSFIHIDHCATTSIRTKTIPSPINLGSLSTHRHSTCFSLHWPSWAVQVCTSTANEHVIELFVDFKKALIRSGGRSCNILDEFDMSVKVVGLM
jgi:hypothetical protein